MTGKRTSHHDAGFSRLYKELEALTEAFERGEFDLDEGLEKFEHGLALAQKLKDRLKNVEQRIERLKVKYDILHDTKDENGES